MAEAEDVIVDAARHATAYTQELLRRRRAGTAPAVLTLFDVAQRLDLVLIALHGRHRPLRVAQPPAPVTALKRLFRRDARPWPKVAVPFTNGAAIWLPGRLDGVAPEQAMVLYRAMALQQAQRAAQRDPVQLERLSTALLRDIYLVMEGVAADSALACALPGLREPLACLRSHALEARPALSEFPPSRRALETWVREQLAQPMQRGTSLGTQGLVQTSLSLSERFSTDVGSTPVFKDWWTGDWHAHERNCADTHDEVASHDVNDDVRGVRSARLARRPTVRQPSDEDRNESSGAWMIQTAQPHEHAEDPMGRQRPADQDTDHAAEAHAESVADLEQARLVRTSQKAHEVLLSDDQPQRSEGSTRSPRAHDIANGVRYPEWDYRVQAYRDPGTTVWELLASPGPVAWVERTLQQQRAMLATIRRRFEMLRAQRLVLHRQEEGDDIDVEACIEARADLRAGASVSQRLYRASRMARRDTAVLVLVDVSGSTDSWVAGQRRIIDVEREALLPLSIALDGSGDAYAIVAFSGQGPQQVWLRSVKRFQERHDDSVARRIAGLEPEHYTRTGAALRHASRMLQAQPARHRLLLLLSDGKPNDEDDYEGRYGVEDMRQAVLEARHAGQSPFCLTVDRQAASYLPRVFGAHHYALLPRPELLPIVLLHWLKRLLSH
jgi:nitric oxide reductase NorD protein